MNSQLNPISKGHIGEDLAENYLIHRGFILKERNWRYKNHHEIDRIFQSPDGELIAVEVRSYVTQQPTEPFESITRQKVARLMQALQLYSNLNYSTTPALRVDVVSVIVEPLRIEHFESVNLQ